MSQPTPAYRGDAPYIFVCYSHEDTRAVYPEIAWLQSIGVNVWYDEGVSPGEEWTAELGRAIDRAERLLFFVTPASVASRHCRNEVHFAQSHEKPMLVVYLEETPLPPGLELIVGSHQALYRTRLPDAAYRDKLASALKPRGGSTTAPSVPKSRRSKWPRLAMATVGVVTLAVVAWSMWRGEPSGSPAEAFDRSISVAPFVANDLDAIAAGFVEGIAEEIRSRIAGYQELRLVVGETRDATYWLQGSASREGGGLRVRARLVRGADGVAVWSQSFDVAEDAVAAGPETLAMQISRFTRLQLVQDDACEAVRRKAKVREAADLVCRAQANDYRVNQVGGHDPALEHAYARRAIELEPTLADAYFFVQDVVLVARGVELEPGNALLLFGRSWGRRLEGAFSAARRDTERALAIAPLHPNAHWFHGHLGMVSLCEGKLDEALGHYRRATQIYDADARMLQEYAQALYYAGDYEGAIRAANAGLALQSEAGGDVRIYLLVYKANAHSALGELETAQASADEILMTAVGPGQKAAAATVLVRMGRRDAARDLLATLEAAAQPLPPISAALIYAGIDPERAWPLLEASVDAGAGFVAAYVRLSPLFADLRRDPRWTGLIERLDARVAEADRRYR